MHDKHLVQRLRACLLGFNAHDVLVLEAGVPELLVRLQHFVQG